MALDENLLDARRERYLEWLCTAPQERRPGTKQGYASEVGVSTETLRRWEKDELFRREWERRAGEIVGSPERSQQVLETLYRQALSGDVKAAQLYLQATNKMAPPTVTVRDERSVAKLSDDELESMIAAAAVSERERRSSGGVV
jgi:Trm5-related predicted tRNA methylase